MEDELKQIATNLMANAAAWRLRNCEILVSNNGDSGPMLALGSMKRVKRADLATSFSVIIGVDE